MKDSAWYNKLWQTKMQELPLEGDEHAMWQNMQGLLDQHMPVNSPVVTPKPAISLLKKLLYIAAGIITAILIYYATSRILADHHEKINKPVGKHALINTNSVTNSHSTTASVIGEKLKTDADNNAIDKTNEKKLVANSTGTTSSPSGAFNSKPIAGIITKRDVKHNGNNSSANITKSPGNNNPAVNHPAISGNNTSYSNIAVKHGNNHHSNKITSGNNRISGTGYLAANGTNAHNNKLSGHSTSGNRHSMLTNSHSGSHASYLQNQRAGNHTYHTPYKDQKDKNSTLSKTDHNILDGQTASAQVNLTPAGNGSTANDNHTNTTAQNITPAANAGNKADSTSIAKNSANKQTADNKAKNQPDKSSQNKTANAKKPGNSKFVLDVKLGANTNSGSTINPFLGIAANYNFNKKWGVAVGINAPYTRIISGSYSKSNITYVTVGDSNKQITHNSGKLIISSTRKIRYVDIPVLATYKISDKFTVTAGPVISIPIKAEASKNTLGTLSSSADTTTVKEVTPYVTASTINSKVNFSVSAGARYTVKRFYIDAGYLQGISPYTVSSGLGSGKIYYHTIQIGIGYQLFKSKSK